MENYDVIVIGGGPSGSSFARVAAQNGMNVLIIDKRKEIGVPVRCGEGLGQREIIAQDLDLPKQTYSTEVVGAKVVAPNGKGIVWKDQDTLGWVLERKFFDKWLCELAVDKGVHVRTYTHAKDFVIENEKIVGVIVSHGGREDYEIRAPLIVSAEGMEALMAKKAGFKTTHVLYDVDTCYEYEMKPYDHENLIELYFGNEIAERGYAWVFPKADKKANVGIGIGAHIMNGNKNGTKGADPKILLDKFIENNEQLKDASKLLDFGGVISVGAPIDEFVKDNIMVIGTGAKQVDPIHGGGIAMAMEAGILAANVVGKVYEKKDYSKAALYPYEKEWRATTGKKMEKRLLLRKVLEKLNDDDLNHIFNSITDQDIKRSMDGNFYGTIMKIVGSRPQLLKVLSVLIS